MTKNNVNGSKPVISLSLETTNICNANCIMCPREKFTAKLEVMKMEVFKKIIDDAGKNTTVQSIVMTGFGEPFCDPDIIDRIKYIKENIDCELNITTNGFSLKKEYFEEIVNCIDEIHVSFYGMTEDVFETVHRGAVKFDATKNNVLDLIKYRNEKKSKKPRIIMRWIVLKENSHQTEDFIKFWEGKADEVMVWKPHNYLDGRKYRDVDLKKARSCKRPFTNLLNVAVDGKVYMCCFDYNKHVVLGDLRKQSIREVLDGEELAKLKKIHREGKFEGHACGQCDQLNHREDVLVYSSSDKRKVGMGNSTKIKFV